MIRLPGMYRKGDTIYKVQESRSSGRLYAKELVELGPKDFKFEYAQGAVYKLSAADMMTLDEAKQFGAIFGVCCVCGAVLTKQESIDAGIGPICAQGEQFANPNAVKLYQASDETRQAEIEREQTEQTFERTVKLSANKYGPIFMIRFAYGDPLMGAMKDEIKATEWESTKRRWDGDIKAWTVDAKGEAGPRFVAQFARKHDFTVSPEAARLFPAQGEATVEATQEAVAQEIASKTATGLPMTFADLVKEV